MMRIKYSLGKTINLGNFQSARVDVGIELDYESAEDISSKFCFVRAHVREELDKAINNKDWE